MGFFDPRSCLNEGLIEAWVVVLRETLALLLYLIAKFLVLLVEDFDHVGDLVILFLEIRAECLKGVETFWPVEGVDDFLTHGFFNGIFLVHRKEYPEMRLLAHELLLSLPRLPSGLFLVQLGPGPMIKFLQQLFRQASHDLDESMNS